MLHRSEDPYRKSREKGLPAWAKAKRKVARSLVDEYGSIEQAFVALDDDRNGVLDLIMLRKKFEVILGGGGGRGDGGVFAMLQPIESQVGEPTCRLGVEIPGKDWFHLRHVRWPLISRMWPDCGVEVWGASLYF